MAYSEEGYGELYNFLGGSFNQDWDLEGTDTADIIEKYLERVGCRHVDMICEQIERLLNEISEEAQLDEVIVYWTGGFSPDVFGLTARTWLKLVRDLLTNGKNILKSYQT